MELSPFTCENQQVIVKKLGWHHQSFPDKCLSVCHINVPLDKNVCLASMERSIWWERCFTGSDFLSRITVNSHDKNEGQTIPKRFLSQLFEH